MQACPAFQCVLVAKFAESIPDVALEPYRRACSVSHDDERPRDMEAVKRAALRSY